MNLEGDSSTILEIVV